MKKNIPESVLEGIVVDKLFFGLKADEICKKYSLSRAFVNATVAAYKAIEAGDWEKVRFMLDGAQCNIKTVEWAAKKCGVSVPDSLYVPKEEPKPEAPAEPVGKTEQLEGQTRLPDFDSVSIRFSTGANNTLHALIDALNRNADEAAQLRSAVFALLNSAAMVD